MTSRQRSYILGVVHRQPLSEGNPTPGEALRKLLGQRGWTTEELALITGRSRQTIQEIASGKSSVTPEMAVALGTAFGNEPADWLKLDAAHRLSRVSPETADAVSRRARLYALAPIRDMQRRGWIRDCSDPAEIESELRAFLGVSDLAEQPSLSVATRRTVTAESLTPAQIAWCVRARQMARALQVKPFDTRRLQEALKKLRALAAYPKEARHLPKVLAEYGIRFVVIEPLPGSKIDGAALWLDERSPVIAVSARYDRIDALWFTVFHEFFHIHNNDALSVDNDLEEQIRVETNESEARANQEASAALIPTKELDSFVGRVGPLYAKPRIIQFAHKVQIHPGIVVGQLQHRGEIGYSANREMLVKVRGAVIETALTDGWGRSISPGAL